MKGRSARGRWRKRSRRGGHHASGKAQSAKPHDSGAQPAPDPELKQVRAEEREALAAIFPEDHLVLSEEDDLGCSTIRYTVSLARGLSVTLKFECGASYPKVPPSITVSAPWLSDAMALLAVEELRAMFVPGQGMVFESIEWVRDSLLDMSDLKENIDFAVHGDSLGDTPTPSLSPFSAATATTSTTTTAATSSGTPDPVDTYPVTRGVPFTDRKSVFQAHAAQVHSRGDVDAFMATLLSNNKIARATHNIMAYRIVQDLSGPSSSSSSSAVPTARTRVLADNDEDGEHGAGAKLAALLEMMDVTCGVVVVTRWYGGIKLGPDRFRHINNVARVVLEQAGLSHRMQNSDTKGKKNRKKKK